MTNQNFHGPSWDLHDEYISFDSAEFKHDLESSQKIIKELNNVAELLSKFLSDENGFKNVNDGFLNELIQSAQKSFILHEKSGILLSSLSTYANCILSVDGKNQKAKEMIALLQKLFSDLEQAAKPFSLFLMQAPQHVVDLYLEHSETKYSRYHVSHLRELNAFKLPLESENLITALGVNGLMAWGNLYDNLSSQIECSVNLPTGTQKMGLAEAASLLQNADENTRKQAYFAIKTGWSAHAESCAAILNAIAGWRLEVCKRRSEKTPMHFLTNPLHDNHLKSETLNSMLSVVDRSTHVGQKAMTLMASVMKQKSLSPWDLYAPVPKKADAAEKKFTFHESIELIKSAFADVDPAMSDFVQMLVDKKWIEGSVGGAKRPGAYCTQFAKSRNSRIYMTFAGGFGDVMTLAHEIGHAFHSWVMKDLPYCQLNYPMNLAETASIFAETVVRNTLLAKASTPTEALPLHWEIAGSAEAFLLNIPSRFAFEKEFYELRAEKNVSADEFSQLMTKSWKRYYGDTLSEMNSHFWQSKLHFYISELSFYNFPYTFGYLFSLGVYAQRNKMGKNFYSNYVNLLRDTGRLSTEELIQKHLNVDISQPDFWNDSVQIIENQLKQFKV